jgi:hypothetical protein
VSRRHQARDDDVLVEQLGSSDQLLARDDDVVGRMQSNRER